MDHHSFRWPTGRLAVIHCLGWIYQRPTCSAAPCAAANKSLPSSEGGEAACQPTNHPKAARRSKKKQTNGHGFFAADLCLVDVDIVYFSEKNSMLKLNTYPRGFNPRNYTESVLFTTKIIWHPEFCFMSWSTPPSLVGLLGIYLLGLGFCCSFRKFRSKDFMQS